MVGLRVVAWCLAALIAAALLSAPGAPFGPGLAQAEVALVLSGDGRDLDPGQPSALRVTLTNDGGSPITVSSVTAAVTGGGPGCGAEGLAVTPWAGSVAVPAHGTATVRLATLVADLPACTGQRWSLEYAAS